MRIAGWGCTDSGQLGDESVSDVVPQPRIVAKDFRAGAVAAGLSSTVLVNDTGDKVLTLSDSQNDHSPFTLPAISSVAIGHDFILYVSAAGTLLVSGSGGFGQLAHGEDVSFLKVPTVVPSLSSVKIVEVAAGSMHWLALDSSSHVFACGHNASGQCGDGTTGDNFVPVCITSLWASPIVHVSAGDRHSAVLTAGGDIFCFGSNKYGQLGQPGFTLKLCALYPQRVPVASLIVSHRGKVDGNPQSAGFAAAENVNYGQGSGIDADGDTEMTAVGTESEAIEALSNISFQDSSGTSGKQENSITPEPLFFIDVACGDMHTVALLSNGSLACWGLSQNGQVGARSTANAYAPVIVRPPDSVGSVRFVSVSAGARHSAAVAEDGTAFLWGDGSLGQIGDGDMSDKLLPVPVRPPRLGVQNRLDTHGKDIRNEERSSVHGPDSSNAPSLRYLRIFCGAYHNLALVSDEATPFSAYAAYLSRISALDVDHIVAPSSALQRFGSVAVLYRTFVKPGWTAKASVLDAAQALKAHTSFAALFGNEGDAVLVRAAAKIRHEAQVAFGLLAEDAMKFFASGYLMSEEHPLVMASESFKSEEYFRTDVVEIREAGVVLFLAFLSPVYCSTARDARREIAEIVSVIMRLRGEARAAFIICAKWCPAEILAKCLIRPLQSLISDELRYKHRVTKRAINAVKVLDLCHRANLLNKDAAGVSAESTHDDCDISVIDDDEFYNDTVSSMIDLKEDWRRWSSGHTDDARVRDADADHDDLFGAVSASDAPFSFCEYSFLLNQVAKFKVLAIEARSSMENEAFRSLMSFGVISMPYNFSRVANVGHLILQVRREHIVADTFQQLAEISSTDPRDLHKTLKVSFVGEEGLDEGGVRKEFFQVLMGQVFSADYGMFSYHEETRQYWFRRDSLEEPGAFALVGIATGLALFNSILLDVQFPSVIYRKLHSAVQYAQQSSDDNLEEIGKSLYEPRLQDVLEAFPSIGQSLKHLLEYEGDDVEDVFGLTYEVPFEGIFGRAQTAELVPDGANKVVNSRNKVDFVRRYVKYLINDSIDEPFCQFARGLIFMMNGHFVSKLTPEELEILVEGERELDFEALRATCRYEGYSISSPTIQNLWTVLFELDLDLRRKFLSFVTGSDRAPIGGLGNLGLVVQRHGGDSDRLPTSHTCFNVLLLPDYSSRAKLRSLLLKAIQNSEGFGLR